MHLIKVKEVLPKMLNLAHERTESSRVLLAGMLADIFMSPEAMLSLREEEMVNELVEDLMTHSTPKVRMQFVERFVDISKMPRRVAANMASDEIAVARQILITSPALKDDDLIHVVKNNSRDHVLAVAERTSISEAVADALITTGDARVMQVVAENLGAHLSQKAVAIVADAARYSVELRGPLLRRPETTSDTALKLYWWVEQDLRRYVLKRFGVSTGQIDQALAMTVSNFLGVHAHDKDNDEVMLQIAEWMDAHQAITAQILPQILRMGHFRLFNMLLGKMSHLPLSLVDTITSISGGRGLIAICRAIGIDKASFVSLFLLSRGGRPGEQIVHPRELSLALAAFDRMSPATAKDLLHSWSIDPAYLIAHTKENAREEWAS